MYERHYRAAIERELNVVKQIWCIELIYRNTAARTIGRLIGEDGDRGEKVCLNDTSDREYGVMNRAGYEKRA